MINQRYLYLIHTQEGIEPFCFKGAVSASGRRKLPRRQIPHRSLQLPSLRAQDGFFTPTNAQPVSATAQWVDSPTGPVS